MVKKRCGYDRLKQFDTSALDDAASLITNPDPCVRLASLELLSWHGERSHRPAILKALAKPALFTGSPKCRRHATDDLRATWVDVLTHFGPFDQRAAELVVRYRFERMRTLLPTVKMDRFRRDLAKGKPVYLLGSIYPAIHELEMLSWYAGARPRFKALARKVIAEPAWTDDDILLFVEGLLDCREHSVSGRELIENKSGLLSAFVEIYDPRSDALGQRALGKLLVDRGIVKAKQPPRRFTPELPDRLPLSVSDAVALPKRLGLERQDLRLGPPVSERRLAAHEARRGKIPEVLRQLYRVFDGVGLDAVQPLANLHNAAADLEGMIDEHERDLRAANRAARKSRNDIRRRYPRSTLVAIGRLLTGDVVFLDLKERTDEGHIPIYALRHDGPMECDAIAPSLGAYVSAEILQAWSNKTGESISTYAPVSIKRRDTRNVLAAFAAERPDARPDRAGSFAR